MSSFSLFKPSLVVILLSFASSVFAVNSPCSVQGYTILTINGVFTNKEGANRNKKALEDYFDNMYAGEPLRVDFLLNPSHILGGGDVLKVAYQKYFEERAVKDYDLAKMIRDASEGVTTQKLLLVPHSQGNFYANSFYDTLVDQEGGVPHESMAIYSVANPADRVAGGGRHLTSSTDRVIAGFVDHVPFQKIVPANTRIEEVAHNLNPFNTHGFADVYLKYRGDQIVAGIQDSLSHLSSDPDRREDVRCFEALKPSVANFVEGGVIVAVDTSFKVAWNSAVFTGETIYQSLATTAILGVKTVLLAARVGEIIGNTVIDGTVFVVHSVGSGVAFLYQGAVSVFAESKPLSENFAASNSASVIGAFMQETPQNAAPAEEKSPILAEIVVSQSPTKEQVAIRTISEIALQEVSKIENSKAQEVTKSPPRLVFIGTTYPGFGGGMPRIEQPSQSQSESEVLGHQEETPLVSGIVPVALAVPAISAPQCDFSLALDGCLLATTTVRFAWNEVEHAQTYNINLNGTFATTTNNYVDILGPDFSDYTFEISAVGGAGQRSATSTKTISLATIPLAINEIAWMGTQASANDEWIELKNNTNHTLDLAQWALRSADGTPYVNLQNTIDPKAFIVLERTSDTTLADVVAHGVYTGSLSNTGEHLALLYASTTFDITPAGAWAAGVNTSSNTRATMERYSSRDSGGDASNWASNLGYLSNGRDASGYLVKGTPGARNSVNYLINKGQNITESMTLSGEDGAYLVPDPLWVSASSTLSLEPGVVMSFLSDNKGHDGRLSVGGVLEALGSQKNPIEFNSFLGNHAGGLWFSGTSTATSTFEYVNISNLDRGIGATLGARLNIENSTFLNNNQGVNAYDGSSIFIHNTKVLNNESDAFGAYGGSSLLIASTTIDGVTSGDAFGAYGSSTLKLSNVTIANVDGDGIGVYGGSSLELASSTIAHVRRDAIGIYDSSATIKNATLNNGQSDAIGVYDSTVKITDTTISDFSEGIGVGVFGESSADITNTEISHTDTGLMAEQGTIPDPLPESVNIHDNTENIYIF